MSDADIDSASSSTPLIHTPVGQTYLARLRQGRERRLIRRGIQASAQRAEQPPIHSSDDEPPPSAPAQRLRRGVMSGPSLRASIQLEESPVEENVIEESDHRAISSPYGEPASDIDEATPSLAGSFPAVDENLNHDAVLLSIKFRMAEVIDLLERLPFDFEDAIVRAHFRVVDDPRSRANGYWRRASQ